MPSGHTDQATINQRRKLTPRMRDVLSDLMRGPINWSQLSAGNQNAMRGLRDRGYAACPDGREAHTITDEGRAAYTQGA